MKKMRHFDLAVTKDALAMAAPIEHDAAGR
jgi:hypothetical protein